MFKKKMTLLIAFSSMFLHSSETPVEVEVQLVAVRESFTCDDKKEWISAIQGGDIEKIEEYLKFGFDVNCTDENGDTALIWAMAMAKDKIEEILLGHPLLCVDQLCKHNRTALINAAKWNKIGATRRLLEMGANTELRDKQGGAALYDSVRAGHEEIVGMLLEKGAAVDALFGRLNSTPLMVALYYGRVGSAKKLLEKDADILLKDNAGHRAFDIGMLMDRKELALLVFRND